MLHSAVPLFFASMLTAIGGVAQETPGTKFNSIGRSGTFSTVWYAPFSVLQKGQSVQESNGTTDHQPLQVQIRSQQSTSDTTLPGNEATKTRQTLFFLENNLTATSNGTVPFWMRANRYGSIPLHSLSTSFIGHAEKKYNTAAKRFFDWGVSFEGRANLGRETELILIAGYGKIKLGAFEVKAGRSKETLGLVDTSLTSGSFSISGNALGVPKVEISVPEYANLLGGQLFAFKGNLAHGYVGDIQRHRGTPKNVQTYLHQKSFYARLGKPCWKVRLFGGFSHQAFWGSEKIRYGSSYPLSDKETFIYVMTGRVYKGISSKIGNHLGSIDLGVELNLKDVSLFAYRQNLYEVGGLYHLANIRDGLHGLSIRNKRAVTKGHHWKKILLEFFFSKDQAGQPTAPSTPTGNENYYNSSEYAEGWSYKRLTLGTPFITAKNTARTDLISTPFEYFNNNRVVLFHAGMEGLINRINYRVKLSYSNNFGTWTTNRLGARWGGVASNANPPLYGVFEPVSQFSSYLEMNRALKNNFAVGGVLAVDYGWLLQNSVGWQARLTKFF